MTTGLFGGWLGAGTEIVWLSYGAAYVFGGWYGLKESVRAIQEPTVEIDLLMILAALGALIIGAPFEGAMLLFLFSLSNVLQHYAFGRSRKAIESLMELRPETAQVRRDGTEVSVPIDEIDVGEVIVVRPGDRIPLDGVVDSGESEVDQSTLTGESVPVAKVPGDEVFAGTVNEIGSLEVRVTKRSEESTITRLIYMVEEAQSERAPTQQVIDRLEQPYVLGVLAMTALAIAIPLSIGFAFDSTFYRAMTLMVAASPCAVVISTPAAVLSAITAGARQGVLFKGGEYVESAGSIDAIALDKTGTLTEGETRLTDVAAMDGAVFDGEVLSDDRLLSIAASVQSRSEHHLAEATVAAAADRDLDITRVEGFTAVVGKGVRGMVDGHTVHIGNRRYARELADDHDLDGLERGREAIQSLEADGKTSVLVIVEDDEGLAVVGWIAYTDTIRPEAAEMIEALRSMGVEHIVMLTGDNPQVAQYVAAEVGLDEVQAEMLPEEKVAYVEDLVASYDTVAMVGDGVNDAPALATADIGVGMGGAGTDVTLETADIVLMGDDLSKLPYVLGLGRSTHRTLMANLAIAFGAIAIMIVAILTAGIPLPLAVIGHEGSTVLVSLNGLRLLGIHS